ncbi:MAG: histidine kinase [Burkholderiales bacterium]|jgi:two-component system sensor histidine kinase AlgZ|nr:histidine kinase [Burkholderiales bacterium]
MAKGTGAPDAPARVPDFANRGVWLRVVIGVTTAAFAAAVLRAAGWSAVPEEFALVCLQVLPPLLAALAVLTVASRALRRLPRGAGVIAVFALVAAAVLAAGAVVERAAGAAFAPDRALFFAGLVTAATLAGLQLRERALSPAIAEARLQALAARIRPHFLFNSINAVLSLVRSDPRRAEAALEDMADLFRVLMQDNRELVPLADEVALCRQYLDLEQLRLGDRLRVEWHIDNLPGDARVPALVLQPLLENAVYHGIEPDPQPGTVRIDIFASRGEITLALRNPYHREGTHHGGNKMAVANIRERLALHFDAEARLETRVGDGHYEVRIRMPYVRP